MMLVDNPDHETMASTEGSSTNGTPTKDYNRQRAAFQTVDWALRPEQFAFLCEKAGWTPAIDVCCDDRGSNSLCDGYIGEDEDVCTADLTGLRIWCNPPFDTPTVSSVLQHVMSHEGVKALVLLPQWSFDQKVRNLLAACKPLHVFPAGAKLYSRAEKNGERSFGWTTRWPVVCWQFVV